MNDNKNTDKINNSADERFLLSSHTLHEIELYRLRGLHRLRGLLKISEENIKYLESVNKKLTVFVMISYIFFMAALTYILFHYAI